MKFTKLNGMGIFSPHFMFLLAVAVTRVKHLECSYMDTVSVKDPLWWLILEYEFNGSKGTAYHPWEHSFRSTAVL